jgi:hypothetical protein
VTVARPPRRRRRRRGRVVVWLIRAVVVVVVFALGVAVGQALEDRPEAGTPVTSFGTIEPWTQTGPATETKTATTSP